MEDPANIPQAESPDAKSGKKEHKRRSFFKRAAFAAVIAGIAGGIGWKAYAHGGWHHAHHAALADPAQLDRHLDRMLGHFYSRIEATEEQKQKLGPIARDAAKDLLPLSG